MIIQRFNILIGSLVLAVTFAIAHGVECYECEELEADDIPQLPVMMSLGSYSSGRRNCSYIVQNELVTSCNHFGSFCLKFTGNTLKDKYFETRLCGRFSHHKDINIDSGECKSLSNLCLKFIQQYEHDPASRLLSSESIRLCLCSTNGCNNAASVSASTYLLAMYILAGIWMGFHVLLNTTAILMNAV